MLIHKLTKTTECWENPITYLRKKNPKPWLNSCQCGNVLFLSLHISISVYVPVYGQSVIEILVPSQGQTPHTKNGISLRYSTPVKLKYTFHKQNSLIWSYHAHETRAPVEVIVIMLSNRNRAICDPLLYTLPHLVLIIALISWVEELWWLLTCTFETRDLKAMVKQVIVQGTSCYVVVGRCI